MLTEFTKIHVVLELAWADFKLKYQGRILGLLWTFLKPLFMLAVLYGVFTYFLQVDIPNFHLYILLGLVVWNFFADATKDVMKSLNEKSNLLQKINVKPRLVVLSTCVHSYASFLIKLAVFFIIYLISGLPPTIHALYFLLVTPILFLFVYGTTLLTGILYIRFDDFSHLWDVTLQTLFWATPIVYPMENVPTWFEPYYMLNPITRYMVDARNLVLYHFAPSWEQIAITAAMTITICIIGYIAFTTTARRHIERL